MLKNEVKVDAFLVATIGNIARERVNWDLCKTNHITTLQLQRSHLHFLNHIFFINQDAVTARPAARPARLAWQWAVSLRAWLSRCWYFFFWSSWNVERKRKRKLMFYQWQHANSKSEIRIPKTEQKITLKDGRKILTICVETQWVCVCHLAPAYKGHKVYSRIIIRET